MPKEKKDKLSKAARHSPLEKSMEIPDLVQRKRVGSKKKEDKVEEEEYVSKEMSKRILVTAHRQKNELRMEMEEEEEEVNVNDVSNLDEYEGEEGEDYDGGDLVEEFEIEEGDEEALKTFMSMRGGGKGGMNLADLIMEKIKEKEEGGEEPTSHPKLNPKIVEVYTSVGKLLKRYKSGKLPKPFKVIPALSNWEEILYLTEPDNWSPHAMFQGTKMFASNLNPKAAQRFYNLILLPCILNDINENKKLNYHLYMSLKKALYKPAAWYKGILLPVCESGQCSLREATILASILSKVSVPVLHSAAAITKIAEMPYSGANSLFIRVLVNKKYSLPYAVVDTLVAHFLRMCDEDRELPVLWHQSLLMFVQRYKSTISIEQKELLRPLLKKHYHAVITEEIRRELFNSSSRGDKEMNDL